MAKKKITIAGAGFAGLAAAYFASDYFDVTLVDPHGIGAGASGVAAGLLHCFAGKFARLNWRGKEALAASFTLIDRIEKDAKECFTKRRGILRVSREEAQLEAFRKQSARNDGVRWISPKNCREMAPSVAEAEGIFIEHGWTVNAGRYLQALWKACENKGAVFELRALNSQDKDSLIIIAAGAACAAMTPLPLKKVKGQLLQYEWPPDLPPLDFPLSAEVYVVMDEDNKSCWVGSTFEKQFTSEKPDVNAAQAIIEPKLQALIPAFEGKAPIGCQAGVRCTTSDHLPIVKQLDSATWVFTGLGSKGLLYHALLAEELAFLLAHQDM